MSENNRLENEENGKPLSEEEVNDIVRLRRERLKELVSEGRNPFEITKFDKNANAVSIKNNYEALEGKTVKISGRLISRRIMGKASFGHLQDFSGRIQVYFKRDDLGEEEYKDFKKFDIGDIIGVEGYVFTTQKGEISVHAEKVKLLSKSLLPLPEKFHGLTDTDTRYRQRYVDLIASPEVKDSFVKRSQIIKEIRSFLEERGFIEVETPLLQHIAGGAAARPFVTHHNALDTDLFLRISLELPLKRLIVGGFEKVYEIGRVFRNEGLSIKHNPEFTLLELYEAYSDYEDMMEITEALVKTVTQRVLGKTTVDYIGEEIDLGKPFERISMVEAVKKYANADFDAVENTAQARLLAKERGVEFEAHHEKGDILNLFFEKFAEEKLVQPTFLMHHPVEISPLAKRCPDNPGYTERFELFIGGREYANAFSELNDPVDQRERFMRQAQLKALGDEEANDVDEDFLTALEYGMPPTGGMGMGVDRFVMLLTDSSSIRDVLLFPTMKPKK